MRKFSSVVMFFALFVGCSSASADTVIAVASTPNPDYAIILSDVVDEAACPAGSAAAGLVEIKARKLVETVYGCWVFSKEDETVAIKWISAKTGEAIYISYPARVFLRPQDVPAPATDQTAELFL